MKRVVVGFSYVDFSDRKKRLCEKNALTVLADCPSNVFPISFGFLGQHKDYSLLDELKIHHLDILKLNSGETINNNRPLPYIKEMMDNCAKIDCEVFGYINSDIFIPDIVYGLLQYDFDAFILSRSDIAEVDPDDFINGRINIIHGGNQHEGADGFFFKKSWWKKNEGAFPYDLIVGETEWDTCYRHIIKKSPCRYLEARALYHVYHDAKWDINSPGGQNNRNIWEKLRRCR